MACIRPEGQKSQRFLIAILLADRPARQCPDHSGSELSVVSASGPVMDAAVAPEVKGEIKFEPALSAALESRADTLADVMVISKSSKEQCRQGHREKSRASEVAISCVRRA
jgi:hypothetical protein